MIKQVYSLIPPRKKVIKFESCPETYTDLSRVKLVLLKMCQKDEALNLTLKNQMIIFQKNDAEAGWLDIEDDVVLIDKSEVKVVLIPKNSSDGILVEPVNILQDQKLYEINELPIELIDEPPIKVRKLNADDKSMIYEQSNSVDTPLLNPPEEKNLPETVNIF